MSCENCKKTQEKGIFYYYRWKNANIAISGCKKHVKEVIDYINSKSLKALDFKIIPYGNKDTENAVVLKCENNLEVIVPQEIFEEIVKKWGEI